MNAESLGVQRREREGAAARVARPHLDLRRAQGEGDRDRAGAGADVGDAGGPVTEPIERGIDECLGRHTWCEDPAGVGDEGESVEACSHVVHYNVAR